MGNILVRNMRVGNLEGIAGVEIHIVLIWPGIIMRLIYE